MADIATVLKKTIDGLPTNTPAVRQKVYEKARATIRAKLDARDPRPSQSAIDAQMAQVDKVIAAVEGDYSFRDQIDSVFTEASTEKPAKSEAPPAPVVSTVPPPPAVEDQIESSVPDAMPAAPVEADAHPEPPAPAADVPAPVDEAETVSAAAEPTAVTPEPVQPSAPPAPPAPSQADAVATPPAPGPVTGPETAMAPADDDMAGESLAADLARQAEREGAVWTAKPGRDAAAASGGDAFDAPIPDLSRKKAGRGRFTGLAIAIVVLLLLGAGGYAAWLNQDAVMALLPTGGETKVAATAPEAPAAQPAKPAPAQPEQPAAPPPQGQASKPKFTQRLQADGTETDPGPAGGKATLGEGTSVAQVTEPPARAPAANGAQPAAPATPQPAQPPKPNANAQPAVAVGQRAIFYEERTAVEQGTADQGNVVWSQVEESPGGDKPAEPAIRADVSFPDRDLNLRITIRRNGDETLPASHIIELVFVTPDNFPGGVIEDVLRITFKENEQSAGTPLLGIPAKIADNFFLVALTDGQQEIAANLQLMQGRPWIDIPVVYRTGRRALITMEKGISGEKVFNEVIGAWTKGGDTAGG